jgi:hypothetical protein
MSGCHPVCGDYNAACMNHAFYLAVGAAALLSGCVWHSAKPTEDHGADSKSHYTNPLSTPGARFGALPQAVQNSIRSQAGTAEVADARKELQDGRLYYKITFRDSRTYPPMFIGPDGSVLNPDLTVAVLAPQEPSQDVKLAELPQAVRKAVQEQRPGAEITLVSQENWGNHSIYIISFKDEATYPKLHVVADGTVLILAPK